MDITSGKGVDVAFEAAGAQPTFESAINSLKRTGTLTVAAVFSKDITFDTNAMFMKEAKIVWSHAYPNTFLDVIKMMANKCHKSYYQKNQVR